MSLDSRRLPIAEPCTERVRLGSPGDARAWCDRCAKPVHMLSELRESEIRALFRDNAGTSVCVEYRVRDDGSIAVRPPAARAGLATALAGFAAYAPPTAEAEPPRAPETIAAAPDPVAETGPAPSAAAPPPPADDVAVVEIDFLLPAEPRRCRGAVSIEANGDPWHRSDRADRLVWVPTRTLWRKMVQRWRARRATRR